MQPYIFGCKKRIDVQIENNRITTNSKTIFDYRNFKTKRERERVGKKFQQ